MSQSVTRAGEDHVPRRLSWLDDQGQPNSIGEDQLAFQATPVVVLAEPGGGKSELFEHASAAAGAPLITASKWLRTTRPETLIKPGLPIFIDALDEASARRDGDAIQNVLEKLDAAGAPRFVLSCRAADWEARGASDIRQDYGARPLVCHLDPFTRAEAEWLLGRLCPDRDPAALIARLETSGLSAFITSPLTIDLVAKVVTAHGDLPKSRAALFDAAVKTLWCEHDPDRATNTLATLTEAEALDAAGAACATLLMSGNDALSASGLVGAGAIAVHEIAPLPGGGHARTLLGSKLFKPAEEPGRLIPVHKTLAEYLGARWLATKTERRTRSRLLARLQPSGSVPARVRGLHAWLAHFDGELGQGAIDCDPFGVIRYGDVDALSLSAARHLLAALVGLADRDPYFRSADWSRYPLGTIMRTELAPDVDALISAQETNQHLRALLIEGLRDTQLAVDLGQTLEAIARGRHRFYRERDDALKALETWRSIERSLEIMDYLRQEGTEDGTRLAVGILDRIGPGAAGPDTTAEVLLANIGLTVCALPRERITAHMMRSYHRIAGAVPDEKVGALLDLLGDYAALLHQPDDWEAGNDLADVIAMLANRVLPTLPVADAWQVWRWLRPLGRVHTYSRDGLKDIVSLLGTRTDLRRAVQRHVALVVRPGSKIGMTILADLGRTAGLGLSHADLVALLEAMATVDRTDARIRDDWRELTEMLREDGGFPDALVPAASAFAGDDPDLRRHLEALCHPRPARVPADWEIERASNRDTRAAEREKRFGERRARFMRNREKLRTGDLEEIKSIGEAYVSNFRDLHAETGVERLETWLGPDLLPDALAGLEAVLHRDDLPDLTEVSESRADGSGWFVGFAAIAGVCERHRHGESLEGIPRKALLLANLHRDWCWNAGSDAAEAVRKSLDDAVAGTPEGFEEWHRLRIEPQLQRRRAHVEGLHDLTHEPRFPERAAKLLREWLIAHVDLPHAVESEMVDALFRAGDIATIRLVAQRRLTDVLPDFPALLFWLAVDWLIDFERHGAALLGIGGDAPEFLTSVQERLGLDRHHSSRPSLSIAQLEWLIAEFRTSWPLVGRLDDEAEGWGFDGAELMRSFIDTLATDPGGDAGAALDRLAGALSDSYTDAILHASAEQRQLRSETEFSPVSAAELAGLLSDGPPSDIDELRALVVDELAIAQAKLRGNDTDRVVEFWTDDGLPRDENRCRDRLADLIEPALERYGIQRIPERDMPQGKRADLAFAWGTMQLPMEIKGQWHPDIWNAADGQLDRLYLRDWRSENRGVYVVFWFGDLPSATNRRLKPPPEGKSPRTPAEMEAMLRARLPAARVGSITVKVIDLTRPD